MSRGGAILAVERVSTAVASKADRTPYDVPGMV